MEKHSWDARGSGAWHGSCWRPEGGLPALHLLPHSAMHGFTRGWYHHLCVHHACALLLPSRLVRFELSMLPQLQAALCIQSITMYELHRWSLLSESMPVLQAVDGCTGLHPSTAYLHAHKWFMIAGATAA